MQKIKKIGVIVLLACLPVSAVYPIDIGLPDVTDVASMMSNMLTNIPVLVQFITAFAYILGIALIYSAINELRIYGQMRTMMPGNIYFTGPLARFVGGMALLFFPGIVDIAIYTLWGYGVEKASTLAFDHTGSSSWDTIIDGVVALVQVLGYVALVRGFLMLSRAGGGRQGGSQPGAIGKALMHIMGGVLAVNIVATTKVLKATFGFY